MYKIGEKVETPLGIGIVVGKRVAMRHDDIIFEVEIKGIRIDFRNTQVAPYQSAHDKLLAMGWDILTNQDLYIKNVFYLMIHKNSKIITSNIEIDLQLSRILTQYLEELEK